MAHSGKWVIAAILLAALAAATAAVLYHYRMGHRALDYWGRETALLIAQEAAALEAMRLVPADSLADAEDGDLLTLAGEQFRVAERKDITGARGVSHLRRAFAQDASFEWDAAADCDPRWDYALRFSSDQEEVLLLFDSRCNLILPLDPEAAAREPVSIQPLEGTIEGILREQFVEGDATNPAANAASSAEAAATGADE